MLSKQQLMAAGAGAVLTLGLGASAVTFAATGTTPAGAVSAITSSMHKPGVGGTVTAVNGNTVTVTGLDGKTYTIDATSASITKEETVTVSDIKVGDTVGAMGTVNGTSVTATTIHDGKMPGGMMGGRGHGMGMMGHGRPNDNDADDASTAPTTTTTTQ